jgi:hypothetical protein
MGPVGVGKTFLANALGHIAVRRHHTVHTERADKLFKRLRGARLDGFYELIVERHRNASTVITSNREPPEILTMMADPLLAQSAMDRLQSQNITSSPSPVRRTSSWHRPRPRPVPGRHRRRDEPGPRPRRCAG